MSSREFPILVFKFTEDTKDGQRRGEIRKPNEGTRVSTQKELSDIGISRKESKPICRCTRRECLQNALRVPGNNGSEGFSIFLTGASLIDMLICDLEEVKSQIYGIGLRNSKN